MSEPSPLPSSRPREGEASVPSPGTDDFVWPPPVDDIESMTVVDLETGAAVFVSPQSPAAHTAPPLARPAAEPAAAVASADLVWPPLDDLTDSVLTLDGGSPWSDLTPEPSGRTTGRTTGQATADAVDAFPADLTTADAAWLGVRRATRSAPRWSQWAAAIVLCAVSGALIERQRMQWSGPADVRVEAADGAIGEDSLPTPWRRGAPSRASAEGASAPDNAFDAHVAYGASSLRALRGTASDRIAGDPIRREPPSAPPSATAGAADSRAAESRDAAASRLVRVASRVAADGVRPSPALAAPTPASTPAAPLAAAAVSASVAPAVTTLARAPLPTASLASGTVSSGSASPGLGSPGLGSPGLGSSGLAVPESTRSESMSIGVHDTARIEATLDRYRTAYASLDVAAARAVWPSVDGRALERAFGSLKSQGLDFDGCTTDVNGPEAMVACRGRATWVPRIGSQRPRTEAHQWRFRMRKVDESWTIVTAEAS